MTLSDPTVTSCEWIKIIQIIADITTVIAGALTVYFAYKALTTWKKKLKIEKQINFIRDVLYEMNHFLNNFKPALMAYKMMEKSIKNHNKDKVPINKFFQIYIETQGREQVVILKDLLNNCTDHVAKIQSLMIEGLLYDLSGYEDFKEACELIIEQYKILRKVAVLIDIKYINLNYWEDVNVIKQYNNILLLKTENINNILEKQHNRLIGYFKKKSSNIYNNKSAKQKMCHFMASLHKKNIFLS